MEKRRLGRRPLMCTRAGERGDCTPVDNTDDNGNGNEDTIKNDVNDGDARVSDANDGDTTSINTDDSVDNNTDGDTIRNDTDDDSGSDASSSLSTNMNNTGGSDNGNDDSDASFVRSGEDTSNAQPGQPILEIPDSEDEADIDNSKPNVFLDLSFVDQA